MTPSGQTVCLCMIVKDEAPVIRRCLDAARPLVDRWLIVDTGSTDGTQAIVREHLADLPGELHERPWRDFAHNRTEALALARPLGDYSLIVDADDSFAVPAGFALPDLDADSYTVDIHFGDIRYSRPQLVKAALGWRYEGVIHEYLACEAATTVGHLPVVLDIHQDGARRRDPDTFRGDALVLERAVAEEADPFKVARYTFYLAQSYRDAGEGEKAVPLYLERADMGFWEQEVYCSLLYAGRLLAGMGRDAAEVLALWRRAGEICPGRAEAAHAASRFHRGRDEFREGFDVAAPSLHLPMPAGGLFVEPWIYDYGLLDEYAVNAYWCDRFQDCRAACERLLETGKAPADVAARTAANLDHAVAKCALQRLAPPVEEPMPAGVPPSSASPVADASSRVQVHARQFRIYRTIHVVWVGDEAKRPDNCIDTWRRLNPDWDVRIWGNDELRTGRWVNSRHIRSMVTREFAGVADMMRWEILERHGGFAIDADAICVRPLENWLFEPDLFACWENEIARPGLVANCFVYAHPHDRLIRHLIRGIHDAVTVTDGRAWETVGPRRLTRTIDDTRYTGITIYPSHYFMPRHPSGSDYSGQGPVFAHQLWGSTRGNLYDDLAKRNVADLSAL